MNSPIYFHRNPHFLCSLSGKWDGRGRVIVPVSDHTKFGRDGAGDSDSSSELKLKEEPDFSAGFEYSLIKRLMELPPEIRYQIYTLVAFSWNPRMQYPQPSPEGRYGDIIAVARRNTKPRFAPPSSYYPVPVVEEERVRWNNEREFDERGGMMDFFKPSEYQILEEFIDALWKFEGRGRAIDKWYDHFTQDPKKVAERSLGVLEDFIDWLWGKIVLDVTLIEVAEFDGEICSLHNHKYPNAHMWHHFRIAHISLDLDFFWFWVYPWPNDHQSQFVNRCKFIAAHMPGILSLRLFIRLTANQARKAIENPGQQEWAREIIKIPVRDRFYLKLIVCNGLSDDETPLTCGELNTLGDQCTRVLKDVLIPNSLRYSDEDESGICRLFEEKD